MSVRHRPQRRSRAVLAGLLSVVLIAGAGAAATARAEAPLKVCADPDNMPFSQEQGLKRGLYVEVAERVGEKLHRSVEFVWWLTFNQRRALRNTVLDGACDVVFAVPTSAEYGLRGLQRTNPIVDVSWSVVAAPGLALKNLSDLRGHRIAVLHGTPPQAVLASLGIEGLLTLRTTQEALAALDRGEVDAAMLWGPSAGFELRRRTDGRWRVAPVMGPPGFGGPVSAAVRTGQDALLAQINRALDELRPEIAERASDYGFPSSPPVKWTTAQVPSSTAPPTVVQAVSKPDRSTADAAQAEDKTAGRPKFNDICAHCHGKDGASPISERDLRRLKLRYDRTWRDTAVTTIREGRPDLGMPAWKGLLKEQEVIDILGFLATIQR